MTTADVIKLPRASVTPTLTALDQIAALLTVNGKAPASPEEIVKLVAAHIRLNKEHGRIIHDMTVANQAAWIEWQHGGGAEQGMQWIENGLDGPGLLPGECEDGLAEDDPILKDAQGYFDRYAGWSIEPNPKAVSVIEGRHRQAKNDRELLDFVDANMVTVKAGNVPALVGDDIDREFSVIQYHPDEPRERVIGYASTAREAIREAIRATDPQGDLFGQDGASV